MKKIFFACVLVMTTGAAAMAQSVMRISLSDRSLITVSVDGRYFNKQGQSITVGDLPGGRHKVQIYGITQTRRGNEREELVYEGYVKTYEGQKTIFTYDYASGNGDIQEQDMNGGAIPQQQMPAAADNQQYSNGQGYAPADNGNSNSGYNNNNYNNQNNNNQPQGNDNNYVPNNNNNGPVASPITDQTTTANKNKMAKLKKKAMDKKTDTEKLTVVKDALKQEMIVCDQVADIMDWFSFESSKVEFAEWAYDRTSDKENFSIVSDKLTYNNYRDELDKFIQGKK